MGSGGSEWNDGLPELVGHAGRVAGLVNGDVNQPAFGDEVAVLVVAFVLERDAGLPDCRDPDGVV